MNQTSPGFRAADELSLRAARSAGEVMPGMQTRVLVALALVLGAIGFGVVSAVFRVLDGDVWARLAVGRMGQVPRVDDWAFTPTLPRWMDHEWGAGWIFYAVYARWGFRGLMVLKIGAALATVGAALAAARRNGSEWAVVLALAMPCAWAILPGFVPVVRSHVFTYVLFALTLWCLPHRAWWVPALMVPWVNVHAGFAVGLVAMAVHTLPVAHRRRVGLALGAALVATLVNPYGWRFWTYLVPAWLHRRPDISEWGRMPVDLTGPYGGFWVLAAIVGVAVAAGWRRRPDRDPVGLCLLALTALAAVWHRRHAPFFGIAALVYAGPWLQAAWPRWRLGWVTAGYATVALGVVAWLGPYARWEPVAPASFYPVEAVDYLERVGARGNIAVPFRWGSYVSWRLYPRMRVSMDGRYETVFPEATFEMNRDFFYRNGEDWDRLVRDYPVDYVLLERRTARVTAMDLLERGFVRVWEDGSASLWWRPATRPPGS